MLIYLLVLVIIVVPLFVPGKNKKISIDTTVFLVGVFLCSGYMTGSDWMFYEVAYNFSATDDYWLLFLNFEPAITLLFRLFSSIRVDYWVMVIPLKFLAYYITINTMRRFIKGNSFILALLIYYCMYGLFMYIDNPLRNMISVAVALYSTKYVINRKFGKLLLFTVLAMCFHFSAVIMLLVYWFANKNYSTQKIIIILVVVNIIFMGQTLLMRIMDLLFSAIPYLGSKLAAYSSENNVDGVGKVLSIGLMVHTTFIIYIIYARKFIESQNNGKIIFNISILMYILFRISLSMIILSRFQYFVIPFYVCAIVLSLRSFELKSRVLYASFVSLFALYTMFATVRGSSKYVPYTNYFVYLLTEDEMPSFEYRENYNFKNSPFSK